MRNHKIAIQGALSSFHDLAARKFFGEDVEIVECGTFKDVCQTLANNSVDYGIIAIENNIVGSILLNYRLIDTFELNIIGETYLPIELNLMALPGVELHEIKEIISHPIALAQCQNFLNGLEDMKVTEYKDTAASARALVETGNRELAVIGGPAIARTYNLENVATNVGDEANNCTRFHVLSKGGDHVEFANKASVVITLEQRRGALSDLLLALRKLDVNLTKIQSLPLAGDETKVLFLFDMEYDDAATMDLAFACIQVHSEKAKVLGTYKSQKLVLAVN